MIAGTVFFFSLFVRDISDNCLRCVSFGCLFGLRFAWRISCLCFLDLFPDGTLLAHLTFIDADILDSKSYLFCFIFAVQTRLSQKMSLQLYISVKFGIAQEFAWITELSSLHACIHYIIHIAPSSVAAESSRFTRRCCIEKKKRRDDGWCCYASAMDASIHIEDWEEGEEEECNRTFLEMIIGNCLCVNWCRSFVAHTTILSDYILKYSNISNNVRRYWSLMICIHPKRWIRCARRCEKISF